MKTFLSTLVAVFLIAVLGAIFFIYSGSYDVAATSKDAGIVRWALKTTRERSIDERADKVVTPPDSVLKDPKTIRTGFEHYNEMCVTCHGAPGMEASEAREGLNPKPPLLAEAAEDLSPREAFWVIKHGIKMTGMPAWGPTHSDDKIWAIVAFVKQLPALSPNEYRAMQRETAASGSEESMH
jgi:mono/diheme cytochrome c family protein